LLLEETSAFFFIFSLPAFGGGSDEWGERMIWVPGGGDAPTVGEALAAALPRPPVTDAMVYFAADQGDRCVARDLQDGQECLVEARKIVIAIPSSTGARVAWGLPAWKLGAITALRPSCVVGVHLLGDNAQELPWTDVSFAWTIDKSFSMMLRPDDDRTL